MKSRTFTEKRKINSEVTENIESELTMKKKRKHRAGKYSINTEVNVEDSEDFIITVIEDEETVLDVQCGTNKAKLTLEKLWQGSKGQCINFQGSWLTPNEFQYVSGRETAKDWKRSIRHQGKSIKLLLSKGYIKVTTDGVNEESKSSEKKEGKTKRRGRGRRRKTKASDAKPPVLVDKSGHLNGIQDNAKDEPKVNHTESTDESRDGNETDDTIENYYSENEYRMSKENDSTIKITSKEQPDDDATTKRTDEMESTQEDQKDSESNVDADIPTTEDQVQDGYNNSIQSKTDDENCSENNITCDENNVKRDENNVKCDENNVKCDDNNISCREICDVVDINRSEMSFQESVVSENKPEENKEQSNAGVCSLKLNVGDWEQKSSEMKSENQEDNTYRSVSVDGCEMTQSFRETIERCNNTESMDTKMKPMISASDDKFEESPKLSPYENDNVDLITDDSPPTLFPQQDIGIKIGIDKDYIIPCDREIKNDNIGTTKCILSLPIKNGRNQSESDYTNPKIKTGEAAAEDINQSNTPLTEINRPNDSSFGEEHQNKDTAVADNSSKTKSSDFSLNNSSNSKRNKRKRSPKHVIKFDKTFQDIPTKDGPQIHLEENVNKKEKETLYSKHNTINNNLTSDNYGKERHQSFSDKISNSQNDLIDKAKEDDLYINLREMNNHQSVQRGSSVTNSDCDSMKIPYKLRLRDEQLSFETNSKDYLHKSRSYDQKLKLTTNDEMKSLINLSATVPRINGDIRTRSPLQTTYDEYMRRLEASHMAMSWNPYFPYFQLPRHPNGMPVSTPSFMSPYPPLLTPQENIDHAHSLKTPVSSPLQSPYTATSPPSFEIPRLSLVSSGRSSTKEINMDSKSRYSASSTSYLSLSSSSSSSSISTPSSSIDKTSSCLTIKPAHSVKPDSICSNMKRQSVDSTAPLDLSVKRRKIGHEPIHRMKDVYKNDVGEVRQTDKHLNNFTDTSLEKKHKKLKHLWINKNTDTDNQVQILRDKCTCYRKNIENWSVDQVVHFVQQLDGCSVYARMFTENSITGHTLQLLTTDHLTRGLGMKVGPAIVLSDAIGREMQNSRKRSMSCRQCSSKLLRNNNNMYV